MCRNCDDEDVVLVEEIKSLGKEVGQMGIEDEVHGIPLANGGPAVLDETLSPREKDAVVSVAVWGHGRDPSWREIGLVDPGDCAAGVDDEGWNGGSAVCASCEEDADGTSVLMGCNHFGRCSWWPKNSLAQIFT